MAENQFKVGDKVRVVDPDALGDIKRGELHTVKELRGDYGVYLVGVDSWWNTSRFELVKNDSTLDLTKPVQTVGGRKVTVLSTSAAGDYPVVGQEEDTGTIFTWRRDGRYGDAYANHMNLVNVPEEPKKFVKYFNVYAEGVGASHNTRTDADTRSDGGRIGCVRVEFKEGQYDD